ncbi:MAG: aminotransferase class I/II-fold pyridoxal phosphate-dependent enzyme [Bacteroidota bacterium]|nr:aminotransferase class I/II-fold pyridoxal phosphate-dependent enzyme [Bacteroidota bacterium]
MKKFDPATNLEHTAKLTDKYEVNPPITDSATYAFDTAEDMTDCFNGKKEAFLYSRHWNPTNMAFSKALAAMEGTEMAWVTGSGMAAITTTILQVCNAGDHIVSTVTEYGGSFAFMKNWLPKFGITVDFVNITDLDAVKKAIKPNTKMIYTETMTNPLLQISDLPSLSKIAHEHGAKLVVDNTFTPMIFSPVQLGADIVVYSMTKYINGKNDATAGAICASADFINSLIDLNDGTAMLLGPVLEPLRASSIHKNLFTLAIRMKKHSENAMFLAHKFKAAGLKVNYLGLPENKGHELMKSMMNEQYGFGGMISIDLETKEKSSKFMALMQKKGVGYLAVSLGFFRTLFSNSGSSTSSEIPQDMRDGMGLSEGIVRYSVGLDNDMEATYNVIEGCLKELGYL